MSVLICKNMSTEGPGTIETFLTGKNIPFTILEMHEECEIPDIKDFNTLVILGGSMSVNDEEIYPFIKKEKKLIREFIINDKSILGICLGAQMIASVLGAKVYKGPEEESGWYNIQLSPEGIRDHLIQKLSIHPILGDFWKRYKVFQWHGETFDLPKESKRLAKSDLYPNQAFKYGKKVYAFQFHLEMTKEMIYEWSKNQPYDPEKARIDTEKLYEIYKARAYNFYNVFFNL